MRTNDKRPLRDRIIELYNEKSIDFNDLQKMIVLLDKVESYGQSNMPKRKLAA